MSDLDDVLMEAWTKKFLAMIVAFNAPGADSAVQIMEKLGLSQEECFTAAQMTEKVATMFAEAHPEDTGTKLPYTGLLGYLLGVQRGKELAAAGHTEIWS